LNSKSWNEESDPKAPSMNRIILHLESGSCQVP